MRKNNNYIDIDKIKPNKENIRKSIDFSTEQWECFKSSIKKNGILLPVIIRLDKNKNFVLVAGHRRYFAAKQIGLKEIPYILLEKEEISDIEIMLIENCSKQDIEPLEQAKAIYELFKKYNSFSAVARTIGVSPSFVSSRVYMIENLTKEQMEHISTRNVAPNIVVEAQRIYKDSKDHFNKIIDSAQNGNIKNSMKVRSLVTFLKENKCLPENISDSLINGEITEDESKFLLLVDNNKTLQNEMYEDLKSKDNKMSSKDLIDYVKLKLGESLNNTTLTDNNCNLDQNLNKDKYDKEIKMYNFISEICKDMKKWEYLLTKLDTEDIDIESKSKISYQINIIIEELNKFNFKLTKSNKNHSNLYKNKTLTLVK